MCFNSLNVHFLGEFSAAKYFMGLFAQFGENALHGELIFYGDKASNKNDLFFAKDPYLSQPSKMKLLPLSGD
jgi:hypothetical protein